MKRLINSEENEIFRSGRHRRSSWFRKLNVHILLPFVFMTVFVVILLTVLVSRIYTKTILDQEDEKNSAAFQYIASNIIISISNADLSLLCRFARFTDFSPLPSSVETNTPT